MKHTLVIRLSALGDVVMLCTILREAAYAYPDRTYTLVSRPQMRDILSQLPPNIQFIAWNKNEPLHIDWQQYDQVIDAHCVWRSFGLDIRALLHGVPVRCLHKPHLKRLLLTHGMSSTPTLSMLDRYRRLLRIPLSPNTYVPSTIPNIERKGIGIAPFAAYPTKTYPPHLMEHIIRSLSEQGEPIYLFGGGTNEQHIAQEWEQKYPSVTSLIGKYSLAEELHQMARLRVMLTMDSGNMHLASLVGTRVISIWGATSPSVGFLGYSQAIEDCIQRMDLDCRPCSVFGKTQCKYGDYRCMQINPQQIIDRLAH